MTVTLAVFVVAEIPGQFGSGMVDGVVRLQAESANKLKTSDVEYKDLNIRK